MTALYHAFWQWFAVHSERYRRLVTSRRHEPTFTDQPLEAVLQQYVGKGLYADLEWNDADHLPRLIISTHGNYRYFARAAALAAAAPFSLPWEVVAFEPPRAPAWRIHELFGRLPFDPSDLMFRDLGFLQFSWSHYTFS